MTKIIVCRYGLLAPLNWAEDCGEHLYRMNTLWNTLVDIEKQHRAKARDLIGNDVTVKPLQERVDRLRQEQKELRETRKSRRQQARTRVPTPEIDERLRTISAELQLVTAECKEARKAAAERARESLRHLDMVRRDSVKQARQAGTCGLWWGNYNAITDSYEAARSKALKENAELRFHRFTGEGRFTVQLINGASVEEIISGKKQASIELTPQQVPGRRGKSLPRLSITVYTTNDGPRLLTFPIVYDYPLPDGCRIQRVVVTRRRIASKWHYSAVFSCRVDRPAVTCTNERVCGINLGFRQVPHERGYALRVATLFDGENYDTLLLPSRWIYRTDDVERIRQQRDIGLNEAVSALKEHWPERPSEFQACTEIHDRLQGLLRAPKLSAQKLAAFILFWRERHQDLWPSMLERMEQWRKLDKLDLARQGGWEIEANKRDKLAHERRQIYRTFARQIAQQYSVIRIGKLDLQKMAQLETPSGVENELHSVARRNRFRASLYLLQQEIKLQVGKFGGRIENIGGSTTGTCNKCGGICSVTTDLMHVCEHCSAVWDQDQNAAQNIFAAPSEPSSGAYKPNQGSQQKEQTLTRAERLRKGRERHLMKQRSQTDSQLGESTVLMGDTDDRSQPGGS